MDLNAEEAYIVHNSIMALTDRTLNEMGRPQLSSKLRELAQDRDSAFVLHSLIQTALDIAHLDQITESK